MSSLKVFYLKVEETKYALLTRALRQSLKGANADSPESRSLRSLLHRVVDAKTETAPPFTEMEANYLGMLMERPALEVSRGELLHKRVRAKLEAFLRGVGALKGSS